MATIFALSTGYFSSAHTESLTQGFDFPIRKLAHAAEYFILAILLLRALTPCGIQHVTGRHIFLTIGLAVVYAISDEWRQSFVPNRNAQALDVGIDALGAICGCYSFCSFLACRDEPVVPDYHLPILESAETEHV